MSVLSTQTLINVRWEMTPRYKRLLLTAVLAFIYTASVLQFHGWLKVENARYILGALMAIAAIQSNFWQLKPRDRFEQWFYLFLAFSLCTAPWGVNPWHSILQIAGLALLWRFVCSCVTRDTFNHTNFFAILACASFIYVTLLLIHLLLAPHTMIHSMTYLQGFGNPNFTASLLLSGLMLSVLALQQSPSHRYYFFAVGHLVIWGLILGTFSRGAISSGLLFYGLNWLLFRYYLKGCYQVKRQKHQMIIAGILALAIVLTTFQLQHLQQSITQFMTQIGHVISSLSHGQWPHISRPLDGRTALWQHAFTQLNHHELHAWLTGIGYGNQAVLTQGFNHRITMHNIYLEILVNTGVLGCSLFLISLYYMLKLAITNTRTQLNSISVIKLTILLTLLWHGLYESVAIQQFGGLLFILMVIHRHNQLTAHFTDAKTTSKQSRTI